MFTYLCGHLRNVKAHFRVTLPAIVIFLSLILPAASPATDKRGCMTCHKYPGLVKFKKPDMLSFSVDTYNNSSAAVIGSFQLVEIAPVPEPATMLLFGLGLLGLAGVNRRKQ